MKLFIFIPLFHQISFTIGINVDLLYRKDIVKSEGISPSVRGPLRLRAVVSPPDAIEPIEPSFGSSGDATMEGSIPHKDVYSRQDINISQARFAENEMSSCAEVLSNNPTVVAWSKPLVLL
jgi:hypothetical protein